MGLFDSLFLGLHGAICTAASLLKVIKEIRQDDCERRKTIEQQEKDSQANLSNIKSESEVTINNKIDGDQ